MIFNTMIGLGRGMSQKKWSAGIESELAQAEAKVTAWKTFVNR